MITFKNFLIESRSAPLYHATTSTGAINILNKNAIIGQEQFGGSTEGMRVVFTTRSKRYAQYFARDRQGVVFVLNQEKLNQRYKIKPVKNWTQERANLHLPMYMKRSLGGNEFEEIVITPKIVNISDYITKIMVSRSINYIDHERIIKLADEYSIPVEEFLR